MEGDLPEVHRTLDEDPDNLQDNLNEALRKAAELGEATIAKAMLRRGAQVNTTDNHGRTPLWLSCKVGRVLSPHPP